MSESSQEDLETSLGKLEEKLPTLITIQNQFWRSTPQFQALMSENGVPNGVKPTSSARRFTPEALTYLRIVRLYGDKPEKLSSDVTVVVKVPGKEPYHAAIQHVKTHAFIWIQSFCEWFEISSTTSFLKPQIKKIEIFGSTEGELAGYAKDIEDIQKLKQTIDDFKTDALLEHENIKKLTSDIKLEKLELETEAKNLNKLQATIHNDIEKATEKLEKVLIQTQQNEVETKHLENKFLETKNNTEQLTQEAENINKNIANLKSELQKLTNDRNLISDEYGPYVEEGNSQAKIYSALTVLPLLAIIFSTYQVYIGASKLLLTEFHSATDVLAAFVLRIPFAVIFGLAILYSWKLAFSMIQKVFKIHSDRLTLAKLLVVARETVHSSAKNLDISDHEKFQEQTALKIEVLKSHMARDLHENFVYKPVPSKKPGISQADPSSDGVGEAVNDDFVARDTKTPG